MPAAFMILSLVSGLVGSVGSLTMPLLLFLLVGGGLNKLTGGQVDGASLIKLASGLITEESKNIGSSLLSALFKSGGEREKTRSNDQKAPHKNYGL